MLLSEHLPVGLLVVLALDEEDEEKEDWVPPGRQVEVVELAVVEWAAMEAEGVSPSVDRKGSQLTTTIAISRCPKRENPAARFQVRNTIVSLLKQNMVCR